MARTTLAAELSTFVAGLITEATPLTFPANASLDEDNFVLNRKGSRQRRLGMDFEEGYSEVLTSVPVSVSGEITISYHRWINAGGDPDSNLLVVQVGSELKFFDQSISPLSSALIHTYKFEAIDNPKSFSYAVVDGLLVVATNSPDISIFEYDKTLGSITVSTKRLKIRDLFGLEDIVDGVNLREGSGVTVRPATQTSAHIYNLRNQTWAEPRKPLASEVITDTITEFRLNAGGKFPSNSDQVTYTLYPDTGNPLDRVSERFVAKDLVANPVGTFPASNGYFIIDALARGTSRVTEYTLLRSRYPQLGFPISSLPADSTPGGATVITEYAGRVWYSGFSGDVIDGDAHSPRMASYVLFSQLVEDPTDIVKCYQDGDPTSKEDPDLLDNDGGFIRIDGAYGITRLVNVGAAIMVVAANGVWMIQGGSDYGFKATNYLVTKITGRGCISPSSLVVVDNTFMYWADDGIYSVAPNQFGDYEATNLTRNTIQSLYDSISTLERAACEGVYDTYQQKVRWVYNNRFSGVGEVKELILDITLGAFYTHTIKAQDMTRLPLVVGGFIMPPFRIEQEQNLVVVGSEQVVRSGEDVYVMADVRKANITEVLYLIITGTSPTISYSFGFYRDEEFKDWKSVDGEGVDAYAYLLTGWLSGGDYQRYKQVPYITFHFNKTEDGFVETVGGDWEPTHPSSCLVSAQWDWSNHVNSGQWGRQFQAYRFKRHYIPGDISDEFNNGYQTVVTKNKLRGKGKVLSLLIETEPGKDCQLLGWSMVMTSNGNV